MISEYGARQHRTGGPSVRHYKRSDFSRMYAKSGAAEGPTENASGPCRLLVKDGVPLNELGRRILSESVSALREN